MRKVVSLSFLVIFVLLISVFTVSVSASNIIGQALTTDIRAYIDGAEVPAYNIDGNMVVVGSDLRNYGFNVVYDNSTRTSSVSYGSSTWSPISSIKRYSTVGQKIMDVYSTDIKVLINGKEVQAYNVDNKMAFKFSELKVFGDYKYDNNSRTSSLEVGMSMTPEERELANSVQYLADRSIEFDEDHDRFKLFFSLKDSSQTRIKAPATVDIRIVNSNGETVYSHLKEITTNDFGTWTSSLSGSRLLCCIYINVDDISEGTSDDGTIYFTIKNDRYFSFKESDLAIRKGLPVKGNAVELPSLPKTVHEYDYKENIDTSCKVTNIRTEINGDTLYIYFSGEKVYDSEGSKHSSACKIGWKLYDSEGYIVESDTFYSTAIAVGEKFRDGKEYAFDCIKPGENYRLEILNIE